jgi:hypothetical protein
MSYQDGLAAHPDSVVAQEIRPSSHFLDKCEIGAGDAPVGCTGSGTVYAKKESWEEA